MTTKITHMGVNSRRGHTWFFKKWDECGECGGDVESFIFVCPKCKAEFDSVQIVYEKGNENDGEQL